MATEVYRFFLFLSAICTVCVNKIDVVICCNIVYDRAPLPSTVIRGMWILGDPVLHNNLVTLFLLVLLVKMFL